MKMFVCYINKRITDQSLIEAIASGFKVPEKEIRQLTGEGTRLISYEIRTLDENESFGTEIVVYVSEDIAIKSEIYNNLLFGKIVSEYFKSRIIINDESDDPYQWILIDEKGIYLGESIETGGQGIEIDPNKVQELSYEKALNLLSKGNI